jgi:O-antigen/teichoic acid export membrane protein
MLLMLPFLVFAGIFGGKFIITLLFSEKFTDAAPVMTVLWAGMVFFSIAGFNMTVLNSAGKQKKVALMVCGGCLMSIVLNCALIPFFGAIGAATVNLIIICCLRQ